MVPACHEDVLRTEEANAHNLEADGLGNGPSRVVETRRESRGDRLGSMPQCLDLQALRH